MLTKSDCLSILVELEDRGININKYMLKLAASQDIPLDVLKFIYDNIGIEASSFYEMLRKKHNQSKSPLYTNILKEIDDPDEVITTLIALLMQIALYGRKLSAKKISQFQREVRAEEIARVVHAYYETGEYDSCIALLKLIKSDLMVLEYIAGRRDFTPAETAESIQPAA